jgi:hypothetical protein
MSRLQTHTLHDNLSLAVMCQSFQVHLMHEIAEQLSKALA